MGLQILDTILWAAGFAFLAALLALLILKKRFRVAPWFTIYIGSTLVSSIVLLIVLRHSSLAFYSITYWTLEVIDLLMQLTVITEIARSVLKRNGHWVEGTYKRFLTMATISFLLSVAIALSTHPAATYAIDVWIVRGNLFTTLLICTLFSALMLVSQQFGLSWRSHIMRIGYGLTAWALSSFIVDMLHSFWGSAHHFAPLERIRNLVYLGSLIYWFVALWRPEREKKLSSDVFSRISSLHEQVEYDLSDPSTPDEERYK
jgi:hypothetical protein